jgi:RHS repeat-associated protein
LLGEYTQSGQAIREYVWFENMPVAIFTPDPAAVANPPLIYFIHPDHLNTPRVVVDKANKIRWRWLAEPFGTTAPETNPSALGIFTQPLRFPGQYADAESTLFYNWNRYYDPSTGRYIESDPIGLAGGLNTFSYALNQPNRYSDPSGQIAGVDDVVVGGIVLGVGAILASPPGQAAIKKTVDAISELCTPGDPCKELNDDVQRAKNKVGSFKPAACSAGMTRWDIQQRSNAWLELATARTRHDQKCWSGGNAGHQVAQADAWSHVGRCQGLLR